MMLQVNEEIHFAVEVITDGHENPMVRADMIYYKTPNNGAMFAPGSLAWCEVFPITNTTTTFLR